MSVNVVSLFRFAPRPRDWNSQELAEFYRVEASLIRSGLSVVTDRGLSDEGDPWFVFCRTDTEEVIVHFARIDGCYVVASPAFEKCVRGHEFRPLIERLIDIHPLVVPKSKDGKRVFIHPAALLAALVTTCFFKLGQSEASAAEIKGTKLTVSTSGSSDYKETVKGTDPVFLNEQAANVALAIIASAASWTPTDVFNIGAAVPVVEHSTSDAQQPVANVADILSSPLGDATGAPEHAHALNVSDPNDPAVAGSNQASTFALLHTRASNADVSATQKLLEIDAVSTLIFQSASSAHEASAAVQALGGAAQTAPPPEVVARALTHDSDATLANQEMVSLLGGSIQAHLFHGQASSQQTLGVITSWSQGASQSAGQASATASSSPVSGESSAPASSAASITGKTASASEVDQAIHNFVVIHPDFLLFTVNHEVILFDSHLTGGNISSAVHQEFSYVDGSTIFLIGLPASASSGLAYTPVTHAYTPIP